MRANFGRTFSEPGHRNSRNRQGYLMIEALLVVALTATIGAVSLRAVTKQRQNTKAMESAFEAILDSQSAAWIATKTDEGGRVWIRQF